MEKQPKTIVITGATGLVGSHLVRSLSNDGYIVRAYGRSKKPPKMLLKYANYCSWDITLEANYQNTEFADVFVHTAGFVNFLGKKKDIYQANIVGTQNALKLARKMSVKTFVYISSASVYDPLADKVMVNESAQYAKRYLNYYAETKVEAEKLLRQVKDFESIVIIRPHAIYGPGDRTIVPQILSRVKGHRFILPDRGNAKYSVTHVGNIVDAVRNIIKNPSKGTHIMNITDQHPVEVQKFLNEVLDRYGNDVSIVKIPYWIGYTAAHIIEASTKFTGFNKEPMLTVNIISQLHHESTMSIDFAKNKINYRARYSYKDGLDDTFEWIESIGGFSNINKYDSQLSWRGKVKSY